MEYLSFDPSKRTLALKKGSVPKPVGEEVLVKVAYSGICGTDLHILDGSFPCKKEPFTLGHEFCGTVEAVGPSVTTFKVGQRVVIDPNSGCDKCTFCHCGTYQFCKKGGINNTVGIYRNGGWSTHALVPETQVHLVPDSVELAQAVLTEPLSCLAHGWDKIDPVHVGTEVLVIGAGIIGSLWSSLLHLHGLRKTVTISEPQVKRRQLIEKLDLNYTASNPDELKGKVFDLAIDCSGSGPAMEAATHLLGPGGRLCVFGVASPQAKLTLEPFQVYMKELQVIGVNINPNTFPKGLALLEAMADRYLQHEKLGIGVFKLSEYNTALELLKKGDISKAIFKF